MVQKWGQPDKGFILFFDKYIFSITQILGPQYRPGFGGHFEKWANKINYPTISHYQLILQKIYTNEDSIFIKFYT